MSGCSVEEIQSTDWSAGYGHPTDLFSWFGGNSPESRDTTNAYSNVRDYMILNMNITSVVEHALEELPEYDLSGPAPSEISSNSTLDSSLNASSESLQSATAETGAIIYNKKIYLAPLYNGVGSSSAIPQNYKAYDSFRKQESFDVGDTSAYRQSLSSMPRSPKTEPDGGIWSAPAFKGKSHKISNKVYSEWVLSWNLCLHIGTQLSKDGCDVLYPYTTRSFANESSSPGKLFGGSYSMTLEDIAEDIAAKKPDVVIFIGFNEGAFGQISNADKIKTTNTLVVYEEFTLSNTKSTNNSHLCHMLVNNWQAVSDLNKCIPVYRTVKARNGEKPEAYPGVNKAQTALTSLRINDISAASCTLLFGDFNSNITKQSSAYSYKKLKELGITIAGIIESSL